MKHEITIIIRCKKCNGIIQATIAKSEFGNCIVEIHPDDMIMHSCGNEKGEGNEK